MKTKTKGKKNLTVKQREEIKYIIALRLKYRDSNIQILENLEDEGYIISESTLIKLKKSMRKGMNKRFKEIGEYEFVNECLMALDMMKHLLKKLMKDFDIDSYDKLGNLDVRSHVVISKEIRETQRDLIYYYNSTKIVENVFQHFEKEKKEREKVLSKFATMKNNTLTA